jgi:hypothetical protein
LVQQTADASSSTPVQVPKVSHSDWLVLQTPFGLETHEVEGGVSSKVVSKLDHDPHDASWSRQADRLVWVGYDDDATQDVWVGDSRGRHTRVLYDCAAPCKRAWWPQLSPDGSRVAVNLDLGQRSQHLLVDVTTGDAVTLDLSGRVFEISDWSADGTHLLGTLITITGPDSVADRPTLWSRLFGWAFAGRQGGPARGHRGPDARTRRRGGHARGSRASRASRGALRA